jgi:hypothetical protein
MRAQQQPGGGQAASRRSRVVRARLVRPWCGVLCGVAHSAVSERATHAFSPRPLFLFFLLTSIKIIIIYEELERNVESSLGLFDGIIKMKKDVVKDLK